VFGTGRPSLTDTPPRGPDPTRMVILDSFITISWQQELFLATVTIVAVVAAAVT